MKILHVYKTYFPDNETGVPRVIHELADGLVDYGVKTQVLALSRVPAAASITVGRHEVHQVRCDLHLASTDLSVAAFGAFRELARTVDLVHYHHPWPQGDVLHLVHGRSRPAVVTYHSDIVRQRFLGMLYAPLMHHFLDAADAIVATSPNYVESSRILHRHRRNLSVIPVGLAERTPPPDGEVAAWRARVGTGFFLFVGAGRYYKGLPFLMDAARRTGLPVVIAGEGTKTGPAPPPGVTVLGAVTDAAREALLDLCGAFVFPSHLRSEAFGIALVEAARAGRPMISCEIGTGTSFVNADGETGLVVPPADPAALAQAMRQLADDAEARMQMGAAARQRFERLFRSESMCQEYLELYRQSVDGR